MELVKMLLLCLWATFWYMTMVDSKCDNFTISSGGNDIRKTGHGISAKEHETVSVDVTLTGPDCVADSMKSMLVRVERTDICFIRPPRAPQPGDCARYHQQATTPKYTITRTLESMDMVGGWTFIVDFCCNSSNIRRTVHFISEKSEQKEGVSISVSLPQTSATSGQHAVRVVGKTVEERRTNEEEFEATSTALSKDVSSSSQVYTSQTTDPDLESTSWWNALSVSPGLAMNGAVVIVILIAMVVIIVATRRIRRRRRSGMYSGSSSLQARYPDLTKLHTKRVKDTSNFSFSFSFSRSSEKRLQPGKRKPTNHRLALPDTPKFPPNPNLYDLIEDDHIIVDPFRPPIPPNLDTRPPAPLPSSDDYLHPIPAKEDIFGTIGQIPDDPDRIIVADTLGDDIPTSPPKRCKFRLRSSKRWRHPDEIRILQLQEEERKASRKSLTASFRRSVFGSRRTSSKKASSTVCQRSSMSTHFEETIEGGFADVSDTEARSFDPEKEPSGIVFVNGNLDHLTSDAEESAGEIILHPSDYLAPKTKPAKLKLKVSRPKLCLKGSSSESRTLGASAASMHAGYKKDGQRDKSAEASWGQLDLQRSSEDSLLDQIKAFPFSFDNEVDEADEIAALPPMPVPLKYRLDRLSRSDLSHTRTSELGHMRASEQSHKSNSEISQLSVHTMSSSRVKQQEAGATWSLPLHSTPPNPHARSSSRRNTGPRNTGKTGVGGSLEAKTGFDSVGSSMEVMTGLDSSHGSLNEATPGAQCAQGPRTAKARFTSLQSSRQGNTGFDVIQGSVNETTSGAEGAQEPRTTKARFTSLRCSRQGKAGFDLTQGTRISHQQDRNLNDGEDGWNPPQIPAKHSFIPRRGSLPATGGQASVSTLQQESTEVKEARIFTVSDFPESFNPPPIPAKHGIQPKRGSLPAVARQTRVTTLQDEGSEANAARIFTVSSFPESVPVQGLARSSSLPAPPPRPPRIRTAAPHAPPYPDPFNSDLNAAINTEEQDQNQAAATPKPTPFENSSSQDSLPPMSVPRHGLSKLSQTPVVTQTAKLIQTTKLTQRDLRMMSLSAVQVPETGSPSHRSPPTLPRSSNTQVQARLMRYERALASPKPDDSDMTGQAWNTQHPQSLALASLPLVPPIVSPIQQPIEPPIPHRTPLPKLRENNDNLQSSSPGDPESFTKTQPSHQERDHDLESNANQLQSSSSSGDPESITKQQDPAVTGS